MTLICYADVTGGTCRFDPDARYLGECDTLSQAGKWFYPALTLDTTTFHLGYSMTAVSMPTDWQQIRIALGELAEYLPEGIEDVPVSQSVVSFTIRPYGQTDVIAVLSKEQGIWRAVRFVIYVKEDEYPSAFWIRTKMLRTAQEALEVCRQQDGVDKV